MQQDMNGMLQNTNRELIHLKKKKWKLDLETKVDLVLLAIGMFLIVWLVVTHEEVRKGYVSTGNFQSSCVEVDEMGNKLSDNEAAGRFEEKLMAIISQELVLNDLNIEILSKSTFDDSTIAIFMYEAGEEGYEGICQISQNDEVLFKAVDKINKCEPFTLHEVEFRKESIPSCTMIYGVINTPIIKSINLNFTDAAIVNIVLGENTHYNYISEAGAAPIIRVDGLDEELNIFYKWDKIYMKPV